MRLAIAALPRDEQVVSGATQISCRRQLMAVMKRTTEHLQKSILSEIVRQGGIAPKCSQISPDSSLVFGNHPRRIETTRRGVGSR
jgi:hypothetical protein